MNDDGPEYWIYHERQQAMLCGQHALNNLVQGNVFQPGHLAEIAHQLDQMELNFMAQNNEGGVRYVFRHLIVRPCQMCSKVQNLTDPFLCSSCCDMTDQKTT